MRKLMILTIGITGLALLGACRKKCNCSQIWDADTTYVKKDLVYFEGKCWIAKAQGRGIEPGPWLENGNDIWVICTE